MSRIFLRLNTSDMNVFRKFGLDVHRFLVALWLAAAIAGIPAHSQQAESPSLSQHASTPDPTDPPAAEDATESMFPHFKSTRFWLSGQSNFIFQTHPDFHAAYSGPHSLSPDYEKATSRVLTLYTGVRLNNSTEFLVDIEEAGGDALTLGFGLAGNTNLDIVRNPSLSKAPYLGRGEIHHIFALSHDKVENQRNPFSLFEELPRRRLEIRFGKFSMPDSFDINSVGSDTHFQFINWTTDNNGAWDYAADTRGYTVGLTADYEDRNWGFRFGEALMPKVANGIDLVWKPWQVHAENYEFEWRRGLMPHKPGVIRLLAYTNFANMGIYRDQVIKAAEAGTTPDITDHPWHVTMKYGFGANLEQNLSRYLTAFARAGWNDGRTESFAYTEVEQAVATGLGASGSWWHRKQDRAGVAFVSNAIKKDHQNYLAAGGLGFLLGDGHLTYGRENILESYYTVHVWRGIYLAPGVQHINNPGYNRDRGPVVVPSFRAHVEF
ncbi:MAG TPA: carbohydrate porin [Candidatus Sulfotelmatobacter sp.]|nr:carbohydrate porin [Candidatus Sulfotelmatobacter sp.]